MKGWWESEELDPGNLTKNQVILQEIQHSGMDDLFNVCTYTLPVYPHPPSQRFPDLIHHPSLTRGPHVHSEEIRLLEACLNHLSRMSQEIYPSTPMACINKVPVVIGQMKELQMKSNISVKL